MRWFLSAVQVLLPHRNTAFRIARQPQLDKRPRVLKPPESGWIYQIHLGNFPSPLIDQ
jgi:hypothetical protein